VAELHEKRKIIGLPIIMEGIWYMLLYLSSLLATKVGDMWSGLNRKRQK